MPGDPDAEILIEMNRIGGAMEVRAVSGGDGLEISFTAPANASQTDIKHLARAKLAYVRSKGSGGQGDPPAGGSGGRGGIVV
jgi:hypothetical protein